MTEENSPKVEGGSPGAPDAQPGTGTAGQELHLRSRVKSLSYPDPKPCPDPINRHQILSRLEQDILSADVQMSLFISACNSYRHDSILKPFPSFLDKSCDNSIDKIRETLQILPNLEIIRSKLAAGKVVPPNILKLVQWVLLENPLGLKLSSVIGDEFEEVLTLPYSRGRQEDSKSNMCHFHALRNTQLPSHIFKIETARTRKWEEENATKESSENPSKTHFGFHGSRTENFHSILSHGLQQHLTTNALFGHGIYFSTDLNMGLAYAKTGQSWEKSLLGDQMSCVIMCQILDDLEVKFHTEDPDRNHLKDSEAGNVPEKYIIVRNNDLIQSKYLLVYAKRKKPLAISESEETASRTLVSSFGVWIFEHKFWLLLLCYALLLIAIGLSNSPQFRRFLRRRGFIEF